MNQGPTVLLQSRVPEEVRDVARKAADETGISLAAYIEQLILADAQQRIVRPPRPTDQQELPLTRTA